MIFATALKIAIALQSHFRELKHFDSLQGIEKPSAALNWTKPESSDNPLVSAVLEDDEKVSDGKLLIAMMNRLEKQEESIQRQELQMAEIIKSLNRFVFQTLDKNSGQLSTEHGIDAFGSGVGENSQYTWNLEKAVSKLESRLSAAQSLQDKEVEKKPIRSDGGLILGIYKGFIWCMQEGEISINSCSDSIQFTQEVASVEEGLKIIDSLFLD